MLFSIRTRLSHYKIFDRKCISNRNEKSQVSMNKSLYLALSTLDLSKAVVYEFWYCYIKPKYDENAKHCSCKNKIFIKILHKLLKNYLKFQILN